MPSDSSKNDAEPRILIVDDDPAQRSLLDSFLAGQGFQTVVTLSNLDLATRPDPALFHIDELPANQPGNRRK